jgi:ribosomal protein L7Ae-like RNA K-turn-binding protein
VGKVDAVDEVVVVVGAHIQKEGEAYNVAVVVVADENNLGAACDILLVAFHEEEYNVAQN